MAKAKFPYDSAPTLKSGVNNNPTFKLGTSKTAKLALAMRDNPSHACNCEEPDSYRDCDAANPKLLAAALDTTGNLNDYLHV